MILITLFVGLLLRLFSLNQSLWLDEATTALVARNYSFLSIITKFSPGDFHPPFYYLIIKLWSQVFGTGEFAIRAPSVIFGLLTIYIVFLIGKKLFDKKVGIVSAILLATSGLHIYYSQEARMYSLVALLVSLLVYLFIKKGWIWFSVVLVLIVGVDYPALLILPIFWIMGIKDWKKLILSHIPVLLFFVFWAPILIKQLTSGLSVASSAPGWWIALGKTNLKELLLIPTKFILGRISFDNKSIYALVVLAVISIFGFLLVKTIKEKKARIIWLWLVVPILLFAVIGLKLSIFSYFRLLFCLPAFYVLVALGISKLSKKTMIVFVALSLIVNLSSSFTYLFNPKFHRENWKGLVSFVESQKTDKSITLFVADSNMEAYRNYAPNAKIAGPGALRSGYDQVWLMRYVKDIFDPEDKLRINLEKMGYKKVGEYDFNKVLVWKYIK